MVAILVALLAAVWAAEIYGIYWYQHWLGINGIEWLKLITFGVIMAILAIIGREIVEEL